MSAYHSRPFVPVTVKWFWSCIMTFLCNEVAPAKHGFREAAGEEFEPRLTDPLESVSKHPWLFTAVQKGVFLSQIPGADVSGCSPVVRSRNCQISV